MKDLPFKEIKKDSCILRIFSKNILIEELVWHRDKENRLIKIISAGGWLFQRDNSLPIELYDGQELFIKKMEWHRIKRGHSDLIIEIRKIFV